MFSCLVPSIQDGTTNVLLPPDVQPGSRPHLSENISVATDISSALAHDEECDGIENIAAVNDASMVFSKTAVKVRDNVSWADLAPDLALFGTAAAFTEDDRLQALREAAAYLDSVVVEIRTSSTPAILLVGEAIARFQDKPLLLERTYKALIVNDAPCDDPETLTDEILEAVHSTGCPESFRAALSRYVQRCHGHNQAAKREADSLRKDDKHKSRTIKPRKRNT